MDAGVALASESLAPWIELGRARTPEGSELLLRARDDCCEIRCDGRELMSTRSYASEEAMARFACERLFAFGAADAAVYWWAAWGSATRFGRRWTPCP